MNQLSGRVAVVSAGHLSRAAAEPMLAQGKGAIVFASDASSFCSGQTLYMHGGPGPAGV